MPLALVHHRMSLGIDGSRLRGRREDLTVVGATDEREVREHLPDADVLVTSNAGWDDDYLPMLDSGDWIQSMSVGYDNVSVERLAERGIAFATSDVHGSTVAEHVFGLVLSLARRLPVYRDRQREREWDRSMGTNLLALEGSTLTLVGLGTIGEAVAERALAFGMEPRGVKRHPGAYDGVVPGDRVHPPEALDGLLEGTDVLVLAVPLTDGTRGLVGEAELAALPDSALLVNVARGGVLDQDALLGALDRGELAGAALDVCEPQPPPEESPLWAHERVVLTPHVAVHSGEFAPRFADLVIENYDRWRAGEPLLNRVV